MTDGGGDGAGDGATGDAQGAATLPFLSAHAAGDSWQSLTGSVIRQLGVPGGAYRLGFLYVTPPLAERLEAIEVLLRQATGISHWIGTVGYGVVATGAETVEDPAIAAMACPIPEEAFRVFSGVTQETDAVTGAHGDWLEAAAPPLILTHADAGNEFVVELIRDLAEETDGYLVGGVAIASGPGAQLADGAAGGGLSGALIAPDRIPVQTALTQGCSPIGPVRTITRGEDNVLIEIDGRPALDVFKQDIGDILARNLERCAGYIFAGLPVPGSEARDYLVRPVTGIDPRHGALAIGAAVAEGDRLLFCRRDPVSAVEDMRRMLADLERRVGGRPVRGALYVSCAARGPHQFRPPEQEHALIAGTFGAVPLVGFFANGEISRDRLYGHTGVLTLFL